MKHNLLLTLGHNSSAILVKGEEILCGYEEERLTGVKSDSRFPANAIKRCLEVANVKEIDDLYVTHWAPDGLLSSMSRKHWDWQGHAQVKGKFVTNDREFTHHDCHAHSAAWYAFAKPGLKRENTMIFVVDGFGNFGEHISIYQMSGYGPKLVRRLYGYGGSMGLMYQYMTAFLGMKMHEDEYKILGYEVMIENIDVDMDVLLREINKEITRFLDSYYDNKNLVGEYDPVVRLDALPALQKHYIDKWTALCKKLDIEPTPSHELRVVLGYYVQAVLEGVILTLVKIYNPQNLVCAGGVFYNVKLNRRLLDFVPGKVCIFPLAGDQGCALGLYANSNNLVWPGHLNWGIRPKSNQEQPKYGGFVSTWEGDTHIHIMLNQLKHRGYFNLVRGAMEFGPRAMCNTSTIALPKPSIVSQINKMNNRNTVMPMAPVMNRSVYKNRMYLTEKVHMSEEHMIIALPWAGHIGDVLGVAHPYPTESTGRPQVIDGDPILDELFKEHPVLINTSFNYHGKPIVYGMSEACYSHDMQCGKGEIVTIYQEETNA